MLSGQIYVRRIRKWYSFPKQRQYRKTINNWPKVLPNDGHSLRKLTNFLQHCLIAMNAVEYLNMLNDQKKNKRWSESCQAIWWRDEAGLSTNRFIADQLEEDDEIPLSKEGVVKNGYSPFAEFYKFLERSKDIAQPSNFLTTAKGSWNQQE